MRNRERALSPQTELVHFIELLCLIMFFILEMSVLLQTLYTLSC